MALGHIIYWHLALSKKDQLKMGNVVVYAGMSQHGGFLKQEYPEYPQISKSCVYRRLQMEFPRKNNPFWGTPLLGNAHAMAIPVGKTIINHPPNHQK